MKNSTRSLTLVLGLASFLICQTVRADEITTTSSPQWEVAGSTAASYVHYSSNLQGSHSFNVAVLGSYFVLRQLELGLLVDWQNSSSSGVENTIFEVQLVPTFNFSSNASESFFVQGGLGGAFTSASVFYDYTTGNLLPETYTEFTWFLGVGKRFEIARHVTWAPELKWDGVVGTTDSQGMFQPTTTAISVIPIQISVLF